VKDIAFLADNVFGRREAPVTIYSHAAALAAIRKHLLNDVLWPDFTKIPSAREPIVRLREITVEVPFKIDSYEVKAVAVNHIVPCVGYFVSDGRSSILYSGDTGPTERIWEVANETENLRGIILDVSFSRDQHDIAIVSKHLSTVMLTAELEKLRRDVTVYLYHSKAGNLETIRKEIRELPLRPPIQLLRGDVIDI
ncbi:MAG: 3',5'-cyclic-nucleotide phosphodiesterase, partial [Vicinamibacteria bacterium]